MGFGVWKMASPVLVLLACLLLAAPAAAVEDRIVFIGESPTEEGLFVMDRDGGNVQLLAGQAGGKPAWSPDGTKVAFSSTRDGNPEIDVLDLATSVRTRLTHTPLVSEASPTWSPDGTRIAFASDADGDSEIYAMDAADGLNVEQLTNNTVADVDADWSPDGAQIAFVRGRDLWVMGADGTGPAALVVSGLCEGQTVVARFPDWSPDSGRIAYLSDVGLVDEPCNALRIVNRDGSGGISLIFGNFWPFRSPAWGAGGSKVAFAEYIHSPSFGSEIYTINTNRTGRSASLSPSYDVDGLDWRALPPDDTPSTHVRPKAASPYHASLVPAYRPCTAPNRTHGPPLAFGSCAPPQLFTPWLSAGGDHPLPARSVGFVRLVVRPGPAGPPDDTDVAISFRLTNVMRHADQSEYTGELRTELLTVRITDSEGAVSATTEVLPVAFTVPCAATPSLPNEKALCATSTTLDAIVPGAAAEGARAVWEIARVAVYDGGGDERASTTGGNTLFAVQGIFVP